MDTIFAPATARGKAGVAVIRLSGPAAHRVVGELAGRVPPPRRLVLATLRARDGEALDRGLVVVFPAGGSFTGEEMAELHLHGSAAVLSAVLADLAARPGLRPAAPGEFTRRALANGRLDLAQVEGLADLIDAETEAQRRQAQRVLSGAVGRLAESWRARLVRAAALIEAGIDFAEEDIPAGVLAEVQAEARATLADLAAEMRAEAAAAPVAERLREGFEVAIVGRPNVGKSTLLNALAGREAALTSAVAGTTRDVIEVRMDLAGLPVTLLDTAGLREGGDEVERLGVARGRARAEAADLRIFLVDADGPPEGVAPKPGDVVVGAKADVTGDPDGVSGRTGQGIDRLMAQVAAELAGRAASAATFTRARHRAAAAAAAAALGRAVEELDRAMPRSEIAAEELRQAMRAVESLVGRVDVEHLLDEIFARFCIGK